MTRFKSISIPSSKTAKSSSKKHYNVKYFALNNDGDKERYEDFKTKILAYADDLKEGEFISAASKGYIPTNCILIRF